jgi:hypothetical protein
MRMGDRSQARPYDEEPSSSWRTPIIVVVVILAAVALALGLAVILAGDDGTAQASPTASLAASAGASNDEPSAAPSTPATAPASGAASAAPSGAPSQPAGPDPVVSPPDDVLPPGSVARVTVDGLRVREGPTTGSDLVASLPGGELLAIGRSHVSPNLGPVQADGFTWYPVGVLGLSELPAVPHAPLENPGTVGWVAGGDANGSFLELVAARCTDAEPTLEIFQSLLPWEQLACYGNRTLTIEGTLGCGGCGSLIPGTFEPVWLAYPESLDLLSVEPQDRIGPFQLWFPPDLERPEVASILRVAGHFDDPAAADCSIAFGEPDPQPIDTTTAVHSCRAKFVVESFEVLGTDEDFPFG